MGEACRGTDGFIDEAACILSIGKTGLSPQLYGCIESSGENLSNCLNTQATAIELFEAMPRGHSPARIVEHLRAYEHFDMIEHLEGGQIRKTGGKPYF